MTKDTGAHAPEQGATGLPSAPGESVERTAREEDIALGQWYWVHEEEPLDDPDARGRWWLACVVKIGSNYLELHSPEAPHCHEVRSWYERVHVDDFHTRLRREPNPEAVIGERAGHYQNQVRSLLAEIQARLARLGLDPALALGGPPAGSASGQALATLAGSDNVKAYEKALLRAEKEDLPALFKQMKTANGYLTRWLNAATLPLQAQAELYKEAGERIRDRVFDISLYAGLIETVVQCADGAPAPQGARLHVMQRRLYADEECLLGYRHGGMTFKDIGQFDAWLAEPANRDRILPFARTVVAMRVRRKEKDRDSQGSLLRAFINMQLAGKDKLTFLYIRNGERLYRLNCELDFGEMLFPDQSVFDPAQPMMARAWHTDMITRADFDERVRAEQERKRNSARWRRTNPRRRWEREHPGRDWDWANPYHESGFDRFRPGEWAPVDPSNVYYDECMARIAKQVRQYNHVALIIQGLFDRSEVLQPHPPVNTGTAEGFAQAIELVYDASAALNHGVAPDFEAYRAQCNAQNTPESVFVGQEDYWERHEAAKECRRLDGDWRNRSEWRPKRFRPWGDPGPGEVARAAHWNAKRGLASFRWWREARLMSEHLVQASLRVPVAELLNASAYRPGDYLQFFHDPRTRAQYLKWAPLLLAAEEFHAGTLTCRAPDAKGD